MLGTMLLRRSEIRNLARLVDLRQARVTEKTILGYLFLALWFGPFPAYSLEKVSAVYTSISGGYAPLWVGKEKQAFEQYGLDIRLIYMRGTVPTSAALANGEIEFIQAGASTYIPYAARGGDVILLGCLSNIVLDYVLLSNPSIKRVEDLRGKKIGISRTADQTYYYLREVLKKNSIRISDVQLVQTGQQPERMAALRNGMVMATLLTTPTNFILEKEGFRRLLELEETKISAGVRCLITTRKILQQRPAMVENFAKGWLHSVRLIQTRKKESMDVIGKYTNNGSLEHQEDAWRSITYKSEIPPYVSAARLQEQIYMLAEDQSEIRKLEASRMIENSVLKKLDDSGFIKRLFQ